MQFRAACQHAGSSRIKTRYQCTEISLQVEKYFEELVNCRGKLRTIANIYHIDFTFELLNICIKKNLKSIKLYSIFQKIILLTSSNIFRRINIGDKHCFYVCPIRASLTINRFVMEFQMCCERAQKRRSKKFSRMVSILIGPQWIVMDSPRILDSKDPSRSV